MFARVLSVVAAAVVAVAPAPAAAIEPISEWKIEPSDVRCVAVRKYGSADKPVTLALKAPPVGKALQLAVIRQAFRKSSDQVGATVDIDGQTFSTHALGYPVSGNRQSVSLIHLPAAAAAAMRSASNLAVNIKGSPDHQFRLGGMDAIWTEMDRCLERLRQNWSTGDDHANRIATPPQAMVPLQSMFSPMDYPRQAVELMFGGTTAFLLLIDETGAVKDCTLTETSGMAVLDSRSCAVISYKARFAPAIGIDGKPVKSTYARRITWRLEK